MAVLEIARLPARVTEFGRNMLSPTDRERAINPARVRTLRAAIFERGVMNANRSRAGRTRRGQARLWVAVILVVVAATALGAMFARPPAASTVPAAQPAVAASTEKAKPAPEKPKPVAEQPKNDPMPEKTREEEPERQRAREREEFAEALKAHGTEIVQLREDQAGIKRLRDEQAREHKRTADALRDEIARLRAKNEANAVAIAALPREVRLQFARYRAEQVQRAWDRVTAETRAARDKDDEPGSVVGGAFAPGGARVFVAGKGDAWHLVRALAPVKNPESVPAGAAAGGFVGAEAFVYLDVVLDIGVAVVSNGKWESKRWVLLRDLKLKPDEAPVLVAGSDAWIAVALSNGRVVFAKNPLAEREVGPVPEDLQLGAVPTGIGFALDGRTFFARVERSITVVHLGNGAKMRLEVPGRTVSSATLAPDGSRFIAGLSDGTAALWELDFKRPPAPMMLARPGPDDGPVRAVAFADDGFGWPVAVTGTAGVVQFWDHESGAPLAWFDYKRIVAGSPADRKDTGPGKIVALGVAAGSALAILDDAGYVTIVSPNAPAKK
jgi:hypothetical protein